MSELDLESGLAAALAHMIELESGGRPSRILIDGRAGSGKSHFAQLLVEAFFQEFRLLPRLVAMDDLYPGWEGLRLGSSYLYEQIMLPLSQTRVATWQQWDWELGARGGSDVGNGMRSLDPATALIVEGCGSVSSLTAPLSSLRIWIESDAQLRRQRYSERDGGRFDEYFGIWGAQEDEFYAEHRSEQLADIRIRN